MRSTVPLVALMLFSCSSASGGVDAAIDNCGDIALTAPRPDETNVAPDVELVIFRPNRCRQEWAGAVLRDSSGTSISLSLSDTTPERWLARPTQSLAPGWYEVRLGEGGEGACTAFRVGPEPAVRGVRFVSEPASADPALHAIDILLSEALASSVEEARSEVVVSGVQPATLTVYADAKAMQLSFKALAPSAQPRMRTPLSIGITRDLRFLSGASMALPFQQELTPADFLFPEYWRPVSPRCAQR